MSKLIKDKGGQYEEALLLLEASAKTQNKYQQEALWYRALAYARLTNTF